MFSTRNFTAIKIPQTLWNTLYARKKSLGQKEISVALVGDQRMREICKKRYKKPNATALTFKYDRTHGEIVLNVSAARAEARKTKTPLSKVLSNWFVHGLSRFV